jgi:hypothetical protein
LEKVLFDLLVCDFRDGLKKIPEPLLAGRCGGKWSITVALSGSPSCKAKLARIGLLGLGREVL